MLGSFCPISFLRISNCLTSHSVICSNTNQPVSQTERTETCEYTDVDDSVSLDVWGSGNDCVEGRQKLRLLSPRNKDRTLSWQMFYYWAFRRQVPNWYEVFHVGLHKHGKWPRAAVDCVACLFLKLLLLFFRNWSNAQRLLLQVQLLLCRTTFRRLHYLRNCNPCCLWCIPLIDPYSPLCCSSSGIKVFNFARWGIRCPSLGIFVPMPRVCRVFRCHKKIT